MRKLEKRIEKKNRRAKAIDSFYRDCLSIRSVPFDVFAGVKPTQWLMPITSINEDVLLTALGLSKVERYQIEGLEIALQGSSRKARAGLALTEARRISRFVVQLAADPPPGFGKVQKWSAIRLLRPFPLGLRFSGNNMNPLPCWLGGAQNVCLNFSDNDLVFPAPESNPSQPEVIRWVRVGGHL